MMEKLRMWEVFKFRLLYICDLFLSNYIDFMPLVKCPSRAGGRKVPVVGSAGETFANNPGKNAGFPLQFPRHRAKIFTVACVTCAQGGESLATNQIFHPQRKN